MEYPPAFRLQDKTTGKHDLRHMTKTLVFKGVQIRERGSISASGFGPGGPNPLADLDRGVQIRGWVQIRCDTGKHDLRHMTKHEQFF